MVGQRHCDFEFDLFGGLELGAIGGDAMHAHLEQRMNMLGSKAVGRVFSILRIFLLQTLGLARRRIGAARGGALCRPATVFGNAAAGSCAA